MIRRSTLALIFHALILLLTCTALASDPAALADAEKHVRAGIAHRDDPSGKKLEDALREFRAAYAIVPSHLVLMNIGYCAHRLERDVEAISAYTQFLEKASPTDLTLEERKQIRSDVARLQAELVTVTLQTATDSMTIVDERLLNDGTSVVNRYDLRAKREVLGVRPGKHRMTVAAQGYAPQTWEFEAAAASKHAHEFKLTPVADKRGIAAQAQQSAPTARLATSELSSATQEGGHRPVPESVYLGAAITGLFVVGTTATGILALSKKSDFDELNVDGKREAAASSAREEALRYATFSNIGLAAAVISAGVTGYLYFTRGTQKDPKNETSLPSQGAWRVSTALTANHAGLQLSGAF